jgi:hypothetical protein
MPLPCRVHFLGRDFGCLAVVIFGEAVGAVFEQLLYGALASFYEGPVEGCEALVVGRIHVCAPAEEQIHAGRVALVCRPHERGVRLRVGDIHGYVLVEQQDDLVHVPVEGGAVQEVEALVVGEQRVGAVVEQQVDDVVVAALSSPEDGCRDGIAALCVDGCAGLDEEVAERVVVVDGGPLLTY